MAKHTTITAEYVRSRIDYDPETGILTWKPRAVRGPIDKMWNTRFAGTQIAHKQSSGYIHLGLDGKNYLGHHVAWVITYGIWPTQLVDHENRTRDDNRLSNLRDATRSQNNSNTKPRADSTSGYRGVYRSAVPRKWCAHIGHQNKKIHLGTFNCITAAALAHDVAAKRLHGDFASLNFKT